MHFRPKAFPLCQNIPDEGDPQGTCAGVECISKLMGNDIKSGMTRRLQASDIHECTLATVIHLHVDCPDRDPATGPIRKFTRLTVRDFDQKMPAPCRVDSDQKILSSPRHCHPYRELASRGQVIFD